MSKVISLKSPFIHEGRRMRKSGTPIAKCNPAHACFTAVAVDPVNLPLSIRNRIKLITTMSIINMAVITYSLLEDMTRPKPK